jgi:hypothetical protein
VWTKTPLVLLVHLQRWSAEHGLIANKIIPNDSLMVQGARYQLKSIVLHHGHSPHIGHYAAVVKTVNNNAEWWVYNDSVGTVATSNERETSEQAKSYLCLYEAKLTSEGGGSEVPPPPLPSVCPRPGRRLRTKHTSVAEFSAPASQEGDDEELPPPPLPPNCSRPPPRLRTKQTPATDFSMRTMSATEAEDRSVEGSAHYHPRCMPAKDSPDHSCRSS